MAIEATPMGPYCGYCGPMPPIFMCNFCGTVQALYMQGMAAPPQQMPGVGPMVAPVIQTQGSAPPSHGTFEAIAKQFAGELGKGLGQAAGQRMGAWM
jgi:hypothetical protein